MAISSNIHLSDSAGIQDYWYSRASKTNVSNFVTVKLSGSGNYHLWKAQMINLLDSSNMCGIVDSAFVGPNYSGTGITRQYDNLARGWILGSVTEDVLADVYYLGSAKAIWEKLKSIYDSPGVFQGVGLINRMEWSILPRRFPDNLWDEIDKLESSLIPHLYYTQPQLYRQRLVKVEQLVKGTAESFSITAVLISTIVFAAGITIPSGSDQVKGTPFMENKTAFIVFVISDAISLLASSTALLVFLSILTARFAERSFLVSLPMRLFIGLFSLFLSIAAMMVALSATLFLFFCDQKPWMLVKICGLPFIPIAPLVGLQLPIMVDLFTSTYIRIIGQRRKNHAVGDIKHSKNLGELTFMGNAAKDIETSKPINSDGSSALHMATETVDDSFLGASARIKDNEISMYAKAMIDHEPYICRTYTDGWERESVKLSLSNELIKEACCLSMQAHRNQHHLTSKHDGAAALSSTSTSTEILIIAFKGNWEVNDFYKDDPFGETDVDSVLFPSLKLIGEGQVAKVNSSFLRNFKNLLNNSRFKQEVEKAVKEDKKILFAGHSSGGAIASLATLWVLDEYIRKRNVRPTIGCVTFGSPLLGDEILTHAVRREKWAGHFTHFVMERDMVPRMMLAPKTSVQKHLPSILKFFKEKVNPITFKEKVYPTTFDHDQMLYSNQAREFLENVLLNASMVANYDALDCTEFTEKLSADFVKVSPYRPFGVHVFCTQSGDLGPSTARQQLVVENPNAALQLLFCFLQLTNEDHLAQCVQSLSEHFGYEDELNKNEFRLENRVDLKHLNKHLFTNNGGDAIRTRNKALSELTLCTKRCLLAVEEAERRKKENEFRIKLHMRRYKSNQKKDYSKIIEDLLDSNQKKDDSKIIEELLDEILAYKKRFDGQNIDYYEAFKLQNGHDDFKANINRLEQAKIWDEIVEMLKRKDLPDEFEVWDELVDLGTQFRRLYEPLDIANYYRHSKGDSYLRVRPRRYKFTQRWYEHANATGFELVSESNFVAEVEELVKKAVKLKRKTFEEVDKGFVSIKNKVKKWQSDEKIIHKDVFWGESVTFKLQETLASYTLKLSECEN